MVSEKRSELFVHLITSSKKKREATTHNNVKVDVKNLKLYGPLVLHRPTARSNAESNAHVSDWFVIKFKREKKIRKRKTI